MRRYHEPINVFLQRNRPLHFFWRRRHIHVITIQDYWLARSCWWHHDEARLYMRLDTSRGVLEIFRSQSSWFMSRVFD